MVLQVYEGRVKLLSLKTHIIDGYLKTCSLSKKCKLFAKCGHRMCVSLLEKNESLIKDMTHSQMLGKVEYGLPAKI